MTDIHALHIVALLQAWCELACCWGALWLSTTGVNVRLHSCAVQGSKMLLTLTPSQDGCPATSVSMDGCYLQTRLSLLVDFAAQIEANEQMPEPHMRARAPPPSDPTAWSLISDQLGGVEVREAGSASSVEAALGSRRSVAGQLAAAALQQASTPEAEEAAIDSLIGQLGDMGWLQPGSTATAGAATAVTAATASASAATAAATSAPASVVHQGSRVGADEHTQQQPGRSPSVSGPSTSMAGLRAAMSRLGLGTSTFSSGSGLETGLTSPSQQQVQRPPRTCAVCGASPPGGLRRCRGCLRVRYCGAGCQAQHWPEHKAECKQREQAREQR